MDSWITRPQNRFLACSQTNQYRLSILLSEFFTSFTLFMCAHRQGSFFTYYYLDSTAHCCLGLCVYKELAEAERGPRLLSSSSCCGRSATRIESLQLALCKQARTTVYSATGERQVSALQQSPEKVKRETQIEEKKEENH